MNFLQKNSDTNYIISLHVKTNSKSQKIVNNGDFLTFYLNSEPKQNKANRELVNLIKKKLNISSNQIRIISGLKSSDKLIRITFLKNTDALGVISKLIN